MKKYVFKTKPYDHQKEVLQKCWNSKNYAWFMEMGTGKSKVCIDNAATLYENNLINALVITAPKGVYRNWAEQEIPTHLPDRIKTKMMVWKPTTSKKILKEREEFLENCEEFKIFIINIEALSTQKGCAYLQKFLMRSRSMLAIDESTTIKQPTAKRTKNIIKLSEFAIYRRILTGFPITKSPLDLWAQIRFLSKNLLGDVGDSFHKFQYRYAVIVRRHLQSHSFQDVVGFKNLKQLNSLLQHFSSRILKEECLDLPEKIYQIREVTMSAEQVRVYEEVRKYCVSHLGNEEFMTANNVMTQLLRLQQILSGHFKSDLGEIIDLPDNRIEELMAVLQEVQGKTIIWSRFRYDITRIYERLKKDYGDKSVVQYFGDVNDEERSSAIDQFQNGEAQFFVGNPQTGGMGITLTKAQNVIYFANSFDLAIRTQSEDRAHRIGQKNNVTYIDFICKGTVDERIVKALKNKMDIATEVMGENVKQWFN